MTVPTVFNRGSSVLDMRAQWRNADGTAFAGTAAPAFGRRRKRWRDLDLIVDLGEEPLS